MNHAFDISFKFSELEHSLTKENLEINITEYLHKKSEQCLIIDFFLSITTLGIES